MSKILIFSDTGVATGYGRIANEVGQRLHDRGHTVLAASLAYDGLLIPMAAGSPIPYWVASLAGHEWQTELMRVIRATNPEIIIGIQDMPYLAHLSEMPIDWSDKKRILITPVDGTPISPPWVNAAKKADHFFSTSHFGVKAYSEAGVRRVGAVIPGVNPKEFYQLAPADRKELRDKAGVSDDTFLLGTMAMNQGRKAISLMVKAFFEAKKLSPYPMRYLLDMEPFSPAGWNIPLLCEQNEWDYSALIFRRDLMDKGLTKLNERYNILDLHTVIAHREGYGLPLVEAMACGVPSMAMDYCSGTEICGDGKGILIPTIDYVVPGTWGGANDRFPDMAQLSAAIMLAAAHPEVLKPIAEKGKAWALTQTWDAAFAPIWDAINS